MTDTLVDDQIASPTIRSGGFVVATRRATMPDVAKLAGVSIKTVSRVVNDEPNVSPETTDRVLAAIEALSFRRNDLARNLRAGTTSATIGLVIEDLSNPFYAAVARGAEEVARQHGALVMAASSEEDAQRERELVTALLQRRVDGLLVVPASADHRYLQPELSMGTPVIFLDRPPLGLKTDQVVFDNAGGACRGVEHLLAQGHRRIGVVGPNTTARTFQQRLEGFREAMQVARIEVDPRLLALDVNGPDGAEAAAEAMLAGKRPPTAFFAINNRMTIGVVRAVHKSGRPTAVVGFDDFELSDLLPIPVTLISGEAAEMGRRGAELLFERLGGRRNARPKQIVVETHLVERGAHRAAG